jgi:uncharacterized YigZ family protein
VTTPVSRYAVPAERHRVEQLVERSRFICTLARVGTPEAAQALVRELNAEFPDATHNCWAYVAGPPGSTGRIGMSDAGEPHGTAGRPMLTVLLHGGIGEIGAVVTRYYGGVKLGTGGLSRAYSGTVQLALQTVPTVMRIEKAELIVAIGYGASSAVKQLLPNFEVEILTEEYEADVRYRLRVPKERARELIAALLDATRGKAAIREETPPDPAA